MESISKIKKNDLLLLSYPFSDGASRKVRPCIVISATSYNQRSQDIIVVPLTTNLSNRAHSFTLSQRDLAKGELIKGSLVKIDRVFSVKKSLVKLKIGEVKPTVHKKVVRELLTLLD